MIYTADLIIFAVLLKVLVHLFAGAYFAPRYPWSAAGQK